VAELIFAGLLVLIVFALISAAGTSQDASKETDKSPQAAKPTNATDFESTDGWMWVRQGSIDRVRDALADYDQIYIPRLPKRFQVELHQQADGTIAVLFPDGLPAYDMVNLAGWLNAPPDQDTVFDTLVWLTSPGDVTRYVFTAIPDSRGGDTLMGADERGQGVHVYLPDTRLYSVPESMDFQREPEVERVANPTVLDLTLDADMGFGNPYFELEGTG